MQTTIELIQFDTAAVALPLGHMVTETNRRSCFVIASPGTETTNVRLALRDYGCEPFFISDFLTVGRISRTEIRTAFRSVDFVVALLHSNRPLENVFFELGVAVGLGRQILILAEPEIAIPSSLANVEIHRISLKDDAVVREVIRSFLFPSTKADDKPAANRAMADRPAPSKTADKGALQGLITLLMVELSREAPHERTIQRSLLQIFSEARITAVEAPSGRKRSYPTPDLALWLNEAQKEVGNPIAIEVKATRKQFNVDEAVDQLAQSLRSVDAKTGILLLLAGQTDQQKVVYRVDPLIFVFSVQEFLTHIEAGNLGPFLRRLSRDAAGAV